MQPVIGELLRAWRQRRHLSQLDLSVQTGVSTRHLSCIETGRSQPSRQMILYLSEHLDVPARERNALLLAAGYAPVYSQRALDDDNSDMRYVRRALDRLLASHDPYPAFVIDRRWDVVARNESTNVLLAGVAPELLVPPVNALRLALHPSGLAPRILNLAQWSAYLLRRIEHQVLAGGDGELAQLAAEARSYPGIGTASPDKPDLPDLPDQVFVPLHYKSSDRELRFLNMVATFGTALDITAAELVIEAFFPADPATAQALGQRGQETIPRLPVHGSQAGVDQVPGLQASVDQG
jgi:transcriptional regulator with XRE-family HTH domain